MRTVRRLRLRFLLLRPGDPNPNGFYIAGLSISVLLTQSILCQAHHKHVDDILALIAWCGTNVLMVDLAGTAPAS